jgi:hypothetical protein
MRTKVGPAAIIVSIIALAAFCYFLYRQANPSPQGEYDPKKYGPPAYIKDNKSPGSYYGGQGGQGSASPGAAGR